MLRSNIIALIALLPAAVACSGSDVNLSADGLAAERAELEAPNQLADDFSTMAPPAARALAQGRALPGTPVALHGASSQAGSGDSIIDHSWRCTDGTVAKGELVEVSFQHPGAVQCTLTVSTQAGFSVIDSVELDIGTPADWTVMVYVNGDSEAAAEAVAAVRGMEQAGSSARVNVVVQHDAGITIGSRPAPVRRYRMVSDDDAGRMGSPVLFGTDEVDSGDEQTMDEFVAWAAERYPAEQNALIVWNHGEGWRLSDGVNPSVRGVIYDEDSGRSIGTTNGGLERMLADSSAHVGGSFDLLGLDMGLMQTWEVAWTAAPYASTLVASQHSAAGEGFAYADSLAELVASPGMDDLALAEAIVRTSAEAGSPGVSAIDLEAMPEITRRVDELSRLILDHSIEDVATMRDVAAKAWSDETNPHMADMVDMLDLVSQLAISDEVARDAAKARGVVADAVIAGPDAEQLSGMSIYLSEDGIENSYYNAAWSEYLGWTELLLKMSQGHVSNPR